MRSMFVQNKNLSMRLAQSMMAHCMQRCATCRDCDGPHWGLKMWEVEMKVYMEMELIE